MEKVAIPYKSGKYSNIVNDKGIQNIDYVSQSLINQGNILTNRQQ